MDPPPGYGLFNLEAVGNSLDGRFSGRNGFAIGRGYSLVVFAAVDSRASQVGFRVVERLRLRPVCRDQVADREFPPQDRVDLAVLSVFSA
ncbi:MAG TPA: hypothetical protein VGS97_09625 [Actinocrinis sp.]|uniref:hypothetical protein n=1 Tax=Actinocrinis sp. TaxID=1920516 RepID=UPI002DDD997B|nr:hypothetical protein [Actinocrinis sp.]HEV2344339.1 hypothetical protein [Actinocrinis sp.]